jgi:hypothetical protein
MVDATASTPDPQTASQPPLRDRLWPRLPIMIVFAALMAVAETVLLLIAVAQALWLGFAGARNPRVARFSAALAVWLAQVARFQGCVTDERPFPWREWPEPGDENAR